METVEELDRDYLETWANRLGVLDLLRSVTRDT